MSYSLDLRSRVVSFVRSGGSKVEASRRYGVSRATVYDWMRKGEDLQPKRYHRNKSRKLDWKALQADVVAHPDSLLRERALKFGVHISSVGYALKQLRITHKKNSCATLSDAEKNA